MCFAFMGMHHINTGLTKLRKSHTSEEDKAPPAVIDDTPQKLNRSSMPGNMYMLQTKTSS